VLQMHDSRAGALFERLERFLGRENVTKRLQSITRELLIEKGTYREAWVIPNRDWWLGLGDARRIRETGKTFRRKLEGRLLGPLATASKIDALYKTFSVEQKAQFKQRILGADNLQPILAWRSWISPTTSSKEVVDWSGHQANKGSKFPNSS
jgi:hypothetical protein